LEEIKVTNIRLQDIVNMKEKFVSKTQALEILWEQYSKIGNAFLNIDLKEFMIDIIDKTGNRVNIALKGDKYANTYLQDKQCYELGRTGVSKSYLILDEKGEYSVMPVIYDGFGFRTIEEDAKFEEFEKSNKGKKKMTNTKK
jgi:hypothetical protein